MSPLPAPPADPLHILPTLSLWLLLAGIALLFLALAWLLFRYLRRKRSQSPPQPPPVLQPTPVVSPAIGFGTRVEAIERKFLKTKAFREGCHTLAAAVKKQLGVERLTSPEIVRAVEDRRVGRFMTRLSWRRYGRDEPRRKHFVAACRQAREVLA